jgi:hypothetical protein
VIGYPVHRSPEVSVIFIGYDKIPASPLDSSIFGEHELMLLRKAEELVSPLFLRGDVKRAGEEALLMTLANEVKGTGVTSNVIRVRTIDDDHLREKEPSEKNWGWTLPEEIAEMLIFLCSEEGGRINGAIIPQFGGG